jgi:imidazolonepropionase-like amidohydrolase
MTSKLHLFLLALLVSAQATATDYYFDNVNVVPMGTETVLQEQRVIIHDGRIAAVGPANQLAAPPNSRRIDGRGRYLIPGLAEMHAHVPSRGQGEQTVQDVLNLYLANGITTIRGMLGEPWHLNLRRQLAEGVWTGPRLFTSGPSFNGRSVSSPDQAQAMVRQQAEAGYDFLKLHPGLGRDEYIAIVTAAKEESIPFAGHVSTAVGLPLTLLSGQATIDHLDGYAQELVLPVSPLYGVAPEFFGINLSAGMSTAGVGGLARNTSQSSTWNVPTQSLLENMAFAQTLEALMARPEMAFMRDSTVNNWRRRVIEFRNSTDMELANNFLTVRRALIAQLQAEGAGLLLGSDAPQIMNVPGFSIHEELAYMVNAGLTPYQALATGTVNVAAFFGQGRAAYGQVAKGHMADLVLLGGNPLADISNTRDVTGVMRAGRWFDRAALDQILAQIQQRKI